MTLDDLKREMNQAHGNFEAVDYENRNRNKHIGHKGVYGISIDDGERFKAYTDLPEREHQQSH